MEPLEEGLDVGEGKVFSDRIAWQRFGDRGRVVLFVGVGTLLQTIRAMAQDSGDMYVPFM
jgi:hypothetical protein